MKTERTADEYTERTRFVTECGITITTEAYRSMRSDKRWLPATVNWGVQGAVSAERAAEFSRAMHLAAAEAYAMNRRHEIGV